MWAATSDPHLGLLISHFLEPRSAVNQSPSRWYRSVWAETWRRGWADAERTSLHLNLICLGFDRLEQFRSLNHKEYVTYAMHGREYSKPSWHVSRPPKYPKLEENQTKRETTGGGYLSGRHGSSWSFVQCSPDTFFSVCLFVLHQVNGMQLGKQAIFHSYGPLCCWMLHI